MKKLILTLTVLFCLLTAMNAQSDNQSTQLQLSSGFWGTTYFVGNEKVSAKDFAEALKPDKESYKMFKSGRTLNTIGMVFGGVGGFCVGWDLGSRVGGGNGNTGLLIGGGVVAVGGIIFGLAGESKMKKAVKLFNGRDTAWEFQLEPAQEGIGLCLKF